MTISRFVELTTLLSASSVMPQVNAASPQTATTCSLVPRRSRAVAMPKRGGQSRAGVAGAEWIVRTFAAIEKSTRAAGLAQSPKKLTATARQQFVHVALMGDVEDKLILWRVEGAMQRDRQLDHAKIRADVAAIFRRDGDQFLPNFLGQLRQLRRRERLDVGGAANRGQQTRRGRGGGFVHQAVGAERCRRFSFAPSFKLFERDAAVFLFLQLLDFQLSVLETRLADLQELCSFLEFREQLGERHLARFHRFDDGLELA